MERTPKGILAMRMKGSTDYLLKQLKQYKTTITTQIRSSVI